jgi:hypothetical protein
MITTLRNIFYFKGMHQLSSGVIKWNAVECSVTKKFRPQLAGATPILPPEVVPLEDVIHVL